MTRQDDLREAQQKIGRYRGDLLDCYKKAKDYLKEHEMKSIDLLITTTLVEMTRELQEIDTELNLSS